jgi:hypothetical protein
MCPICHIVTTIDRGVLFVPGNGVYSFQRGWGGRWPRPPGQLSFEWSGVGVTFAASRFIWLPMRRSGIEQPRIEDQSLNATQATNEPRPLSWRGKTRPKQPATPPDRNQMPKSANLRVSHIGMTISHGRPSARQSSRTSPLSWSRIIASACARFNGTREAVQPRF